MSCLVGANSSRCFRGVYQARSPIYDMEECGEISKRSAPVQVALDNEGSVLHHEKVKQEHSDPN